MNGPAMAVRRPADRRAVTLATPQMGRSPRRCCPVGPADRSTPDQRTRGQARVGPDPGFRRTALGWRSPTRRAAPRRAGQRCRAGGRPDMADRAARGRARTCQAALTRTGCAGRYPSAGTCPPGTAASIRPTTRCWPLPARGGNPAARRFPVARPRQDGGGRDAGAADQHALPGGRAVPRRGRGGARGLRPQAAGAVHGACRRGARRRAPPMVRHPGGRGHLRRRHARGVAPSHAVGANADRLGELLAGPVLIGLAGPAGSCPPGRPQPGGLYLSWHWPGPRRGWPPVYRPG